MYKSSKSLIKGVTITLVLTLVIGVTFSLVSSRKERTKNDIVDASVLVANKLVQMYHGSEPLVGDQSLNERIFAPELVGQVLDFEDSLKSLDKRHFYIDAYHSKVVGNDNADTEYVESSPVADDPDGYVAPSYDSNTDTTLPDDSRILTDDKGDYMTLDSFEFEDGVRDIIAYRGVNMIIPKEDVPESYHRMVKNPANYYVYVTYSSTKEGNTRYTDVQFRSVVSGEYLVVRVYNTGKKVTSFNAEELIPIVD